MAHNNNGNGIKPETKQKFKRKNSLEGFFTQPSNGAGKSFIGRDVQHWKYEDSSLRYQG